MGDVTETAPTLLSHRDKGVLWLTLNRAHKANALTVDMSRALAQALAGAQDDPDLRAVVITGSGPKMFCAGVDLRETSPDGDAASQRAARSAATAAVQDLIVSTPLPVIVALNGLAVGAGAMIALIADHCIAAETAALSLPEIDIAIPTFSGASILATRCGTALARDLIQTGRRMGAREAAERGLLQVVAAEDLTQAVQSFAETLGAKDRRTFGEVKAWMNRGLVAAIADARDAHAAHRARAKAATGAQHA